MAWWKVHDTDDVVGDEVFSLLRNAALAVLEEYEEELGRPPTRSEWERLLHDAVQPMDSVDFGSQKALMADESAPPRAVRIIIEA